MRFPALGETDLLLLLHQGLFEQPMWSGFLAGLRSVAGVDQASLVLRAPENGEAIELHDRHGTPPHHLAHLFTSADPVMREARAYTLAELDLDSPPEIAHMRAVRVSEPGGIDAWLVLAGDRDAGAAAGSLLGALAPHLRAALRTFAAIERERARSNLSADAFSRMNFGWISLDAHCRIIDCDPQAEQVLRQSGLLRRGPYDRLTPASPIIDRALTRLARNFAADPDARPQAINLSHDPWIDILVAPLRLRSLAAGVQAAAVVYLRGDRSSTADRCEQLSDLFQLTPSEARLAWSMAQGLSIAEAAAERGLTIETARNYSKKIYAKTGARGQADLVRHILTGVLALA